MSFAMSISDFARIRSYDDAAAYFEKTKPVRGYTKETHGVPLKTNRRNLHTMMLRYDGKNDVYMCRLYRTDVVKFYKDGRMGVDTGYFHSNSTNTFANAFLPVWLYASTFGSKPVIGNYYVPRNGEVIIRNGEIDVSTTARMMVERTNRKIANAARKSVAPLLVYIDTLKKAEVEFDAEEGQRIMGEYVKAKDQNDDLLGKMMRMSTREVLTIDTMKDEDAYPVIASCIAYNQYSWEQRRYIRRIGSGGVSMLLNALYIESGAYYWEPLPPGKLHKDARYYDENAMF